MDFVLTVKFVPSQFVHLENRRDTLKLFKELDISLDKKELISINGGGGKTTSMFRLGRELSSKGKKVLISTTTAIMKPDETKYKYLYLSKNIDYRDMKPSIGSITILAQQIDREKNKLMGVDKELIDEIYRSNIFDYIIVETDGAKRKSIKAPADHEPVVPSLTSKTIGLIGMDCIGKKIYEENVHRANTFAQITNSKLGDLIDDKVIYNLLVSKDGIFKNTPSSSDKYVILNKVETKERRNASEKIKSKVLSSKVHIKKIIAGSMGKEARVTGLIMASGFSRRMKTDKLLLSFGVQTVVERVIDACLGSNLDEIILVYRKPEVRDMVRKSKVKTVLNDQALEGQSASIKTGISQVEENMDGLMFIVGDQPLLDSQTIDKLIDEFEQNPDKIIIPVYGENKGNPIIFPRSLINELKNLEGDVGGREVINNNLDKVKYIGIDNHKAGLDMDTVEEYEKLKEEF